ncbi:phosphatidylinositol transfer protein [Kipferlia bialata]|uniref:Phosphatidylinositol transfer protein n=1 Tax=Kipferlia bialata TaxID=797122 RepID=A0A9K3CTK9_9EUKA|nr:phosphatidylinositol transfer protein [Kipferlia bialata]GIQ85492.1 phosphatidylinositol transfer protein [Kipferlia bialata]|eukprot:g4217.t1
MRVQSSNPLRLCTDVPVSLPAAMYLFQYAITLPLTAAETDRGHHYMVARASLEDSTSAEGIEPIVNVGIRHEDRDARLTFKRIHLPKGKVTKIMPARARFVNEFCINASTHVVNKLSSPFLKSKLTFELHTRLIDGDRGQDRDTANPFNLSEASTVQRYTVDIASHHGDDIDPSKQTFTTPELAQRVPVSTKGWESTCTPCVTVYKLVKFELKVMGLGRVAKNSVQKAMFNNFVTYHAKLYCWADSWYSQTRDSILAFEAAELDKLSLFWENVYAEGTKERPSIPDAIWALLPGDERERLQAQRGEEAEIEAEAEAETEPIPQQ